MVSTISLGKVTAAEVHAVRRINKKITFVILVNPYTIDIQNMRIPEKKAPSKNNLLRLLRCMLSDAFA